MQGMFNQAFVFNHPIDHSITPSVTNMQGMFRDTSSFDQQIGNWDILSVTNMTDMFFNVVLSDNNKGEIHKTFSSNPNWPYDWTEFVVFDLTRGLVAWYPFDGNASDMSGNGHHGTVHGASLGTDRHGVANRAYSFDGVNDWILLGNSLLPTNGENWSTIMWVQNPQANSSHGILLSQYGNSSEDFNSLQLRLMK